MHSNVISELLYASLFFWSSFDASLFQSQNTKEETESFLLADNYKCRYVLWILANCSNKRRRVLKWKPILHLCVYLVSRRTNQMGSVLTCASRIQAIIYIDENIWLCTLTLTHTSAYTRVRTHTHIHTRMHAHTRTHTHTHIHTHTHTEAYRHAHTYTDEYTSIHLEKYRCIRSAFIEAFICINLSSWPDY